MRSLLERPRVESGVINALSFDVEDYYQVSNFASLVPYDRWGRYESRVERNTRKILDRHDTRATFFILGWIAERHSGLVREIADAGHEIGTHSYQHRLVYDLSREEFRDDLRRSIAIIEDASGQRVVGHRAPSFSITKDSMWALEILRDEGLEYDSSIFPVRHPRYGVPGAPRRPYEICEGLLEFPLATVKFGRWSVPIGGGGYFRLYPYAVTDWGLRQINRENLPAMVYLHPWELDPEQPRFEASWSARFRHYRDLDKTESRLDRMLRQFRFTAAADVLGL